MLRTDTLRVHVWLTVFGFAGWLSTSCSATRGAPFDPTLVGREHYLCCTTDFNLERAAADSNYALYMYDQAYQAGPKLPAGMRVRVTKVGADGVEIVPIEGGAPYTIYFRYGRAQESPNQYFGKILLDADPMNGVTTVTTSAAIRDGRLVEGMTKQEALLARGYPPAHRTPHLDANEWIYYETPGVVDRVVFVDDKIRSITRGPAPQ